QRQVGAAHLVLRLGVGGLRLAGGHRGVTGLVEEAHSLARPGAGSPPQAGSATSSSRTGASPAAPTAAGLPASPASQPRPSPAPSSRGPWPPAPTAAASRATTARP